MGDKSIAFVSKALELAAQNPILVPAYLDLSEAEKDFELTQNLMPIEQELLTLLRAVEDVMMVAGSDVPGAQAVYDELSSRFPRRASRTIETDES